MNGRNWEMVSKTWEQSSSGCYSTIGMETSAVADVGGGGVVVADVDLGSA
jgi:hypothetical protein